MICLDGDHWVDSSKPTMALQQSPLVRTLGAAEGFDLDLGLFLLHIHKMMVLCSPLFKLQCLLQRLRAWETSGVTVFILISVNATCAFFPPGYYMSLLLGIITICAIMGMAHRRTRCLAKVFPSEDIKMEDLGTINGPLSHEEIILYYKITLFKINRCIQQFNDQMSFVYSVLKWDSLFPSIRFYTCLFLLTLSLHIFPLRWTVAMVINVFLLEGKISKTIFDYTQIYNKQDTVTQDGSFTDNGEDCISQFSQESVMTENFASPPSDSDSDLSEKGDSSSGENSDYETQSVQDVSKAKGVRAKGAGVVGKIMEFKKKHQGAAAGACVSCSVSFSSILKRKHICSHCGNHFCSRCCAKKVPRSMFGATAPAAQTETVPVCQFCYMYLTEQKV